MKTTTLALAAAAVLLTAPVSHAELAPLISASDPPILTATQSWEQKAVFEPTVIYDHGVYRMWYSGGWDVCLMGYAESRDGFHWTKHDGPVLGGGGAMACQNNVILIGGIFYAYFDTGGGSRDLSVATSRDGIRWTVSPEPAVRATADATRLVNSAIWRDGTVWRMLVESDSPDHVWRTWNAEGDSPTSLHITSPVAGYSRGGMFGGPCRAEDGTVYFHAATSTGNLPTDIYLADATGIHLALAHTWAGVDGDQVADPSVANGLLFFDGVDNASARAAIGVARLPLAAGSGMPLPRPYVTRARAEPV